MLVGGRIKSVKINNLILRWALNLDAVLYHSNDGSTNLCRGLQLKVDKVYLRHLCGASYQRNHSAALPYLLKGVCRKLVINVSVRRGEDRIRDSLLKHVCRKAVISWLSSVR